MNNIKSKSFYICKITVIIKIMRKLLLIILLIVCTAGVGNNSVLADDLDNVQIEMRNYDGIEVPAGTFIPVISTQEVSTQYCPEGYKVKFRSSNDLFMYDTKIIPQDTEFYGYIEKLNEPIVGTHASMKIKMTKMVYADGYEVPIRGYIYTTNGNLIGGGISEPAEWIKMPHYNTRYKKATLQVMPGAERKMGNHISISAGEDRLIILTDSAYITHTLTN